MSNIGKPWVRIVIVAYNSRDNLQDCIDALQRQTDENFEVIIVDNDSSDGCIEHLTIPDDRFQILKSDVNLGFAGGSNLGLKGATTPYVMTVNPDVRLKRNCLKRLGKIAVAYPNVAMLAPILLQMERKKRLDGLGDVLSIFGLAWRGGQGRKFRRNEPLETWSIFSPCGAAALYKTDEFNRQGGFDEAFFCYLEDVDLGLRINASGGSSLLVHNAKAFHVGGASTGKISGFREYYTCRNNLRMIIKSAPLAILPLMLMGYFSSQAWITMRNRKDPVIKYRLKGYKAALKAIPSSIKARLSRPPYGFGASLRIAKKIIWRRKDLRASSPHIWDIEANDDDDEFNQLSAQ